MHHHDTSWIHHHGVSRMLSPTIDSVVELILHPTIGGISLAAEIQIDFSRDIRGVNHAQFDMAEG